MPPGLSQGGPDPRAPHKGAQQGRLALLCKLCAGHAVPACPQPGAVPTVPCPPAQGLGLPCPGLVAPVPPRNGSTNPPLCFWSCWQGGLGALPAPPLWGHCLLPVTSSWDPPRWPCPGVPQEGALVPPIPIMGQPQSQLCPGVLWPRPGVGTPHLYLLQRETIYREIYIFKLILKDLFLSLQPRLAAQGAGREGADPLPVQGCPLEAAGAWDGGADLVHAPALWGAGWPRAAHPLRHAVPCLSFPTGERGRAGDWGRAMEPVAPTAQAGFWGGGLVLGVVLAGPSP